MDLKKIGFQLPDRIRFDEESLTNTYGKLIAEPLERGFGTTVGNALRRVLLSSIEGAAVTAVKIEGVLHEFSSISGVTEDVTDIVLNLKQIPIKMHTYEPRILRINQEGPRDILSSDIILPQNVEVLDPS